MTVRIGLVAGALFALMALVGCPPQTDEPVAGETRVFDGVEFQWCPPGTFSMGSPGDEEGRDPDETAHQVTISEGFWLSTYEITQKDWKKVMGNNPSFNKDKHRPVERVSWVDVQNYITLLNQAKGSAAQYRLPTEAEWEYACRAGTNKRFYWGNDPNEQNVGDYAWFSGNSGGETAQVGGKEPNDWGLYDMSGNVAEWVQDWYGLYDTDPQTDPQGPDSSVEGRVFRGGWIQVGEDDVRSAQRFSDNPEYTDFGIGFRLLRTAN